MSWNATAECDGGACKGGEKNTTQPVGRILAKPCPKVQGEDFLKPLVLPLQACFLCLSERGRNTFLPARFVAWAGVNQTTISDIDYSLLIGNIVP